MPEPWSENVPAYPFYLGNYGYKEDLPEITFPTKARGVADSGYNPWRVRISSDGGDPVTWTASVTEGEIVDAINSVTKLTFEEGEDFSVAVVEDDVVCIKYNYSDGAITIDVLNDGESPNQFTPIIDDGGDPATVTGSLYPLAKIINTADPADDPVLTVRQLAKSNLKKTTVCINGNALTTFGPI